MNHCFCSYRGEADVISTHLSGFWAPCRWFEYNLPRSLQCYGTIMSSDLLNPFFSPSGPKNDLAARVVRPGNTVAPSGNKIVVSLLDAVIDLDQSFCQILWCQQLSLSLPHIPSPYLLLLLNTWLST